MLKTKKFKWLIFFLSFIFWIPEVHSQSTGTRKAQENQCLDSLSYQLYLCINKYRSDNHLAGIPLSVSLCYVAQVHAKDLTYNRPAGRSCSLHSWSDRGRWSPCCFSDANPAYPCMWNKPKELTRYKFKGYEIIYWENDLITPLTALTQWKLQAHFNDMILNKGSWTKKTWRAIGICIFEGYAIIWLGEEADVQGEPEPCVKPVVIIGDTSAKNDSAVTQNTPVTGIRYYLITASLTSMDKADQVLKEYHGKGFNKARIIIFDQKIRISINDFATYSEARQVKADLGQEFQHVWILEH